MWTQMAILRHGYLGICTHGIWFATDWISRLMFQGLCNGYGVSPDPRSAPETMYRPECPSRDTLHLNPSKDKPPGPSTTSLFVRENILLWIMLLIWYHCVEEKNHFVALFSLFIVAFWELWSGEPGLCSISLSCPGNWPWMYLHCKLSGCSFTMSLNRKVPCLSQ